MARILNKIREQVGPIAGSANSVVTSATSDISEKRLQLVADFEKSGMGWFWSTDADGNLTYLSAPVAQCFGKTPEEILRSEFLPLFRSVKDAGRDSQRTLPLMMRGRKPFTNLTVRPAITGKEILWTLSGQPQFDAKGAFLGYNGYGADITEDRRSDDEKSRMAVSDSLTGLSNRHSMIQRMNSMLAAFRAAKRSCALLMVDLDRFKQVNDTLGHAAGDDLLRQVAQRLKSVLDSQFEIARVGGDEFQILLPDVDDRGRLGDIAKKIITVISQPYTLDEGRAVIGASVGVAVAPYDGIDREELVRSADLALYAAKGGGRGHFRFYSSDLQSDAASRTHLAGELREALGKNQISLHYQPIVNVEDNSVVAFEALMRWNHPERGDVPPAEFIPLAEQNNLIVSLGEWALRTACEQAMQWPEKLNVAVNVSSAELANEGFARMVGTALDSSGLPPERLELDLGESVFLSENGTIETTLRALRKLGVRLSLDDFGTGLLSFQHLSRMPFDKLKIDRCFLPGAVDPNSRKAAIIGSMVALAEALDMDTVLEGVESLDELELARQKGVSNVQGFVYLPAVPQAEVCERLRENGCALEPSGPGKQRDERRKLFRKVHVIHEDHLYDVTLRNLSRTGAMIEGLADVPAGTQFVVDFGEGQLAVATVRRVHDDSQGLQFETPLVDDGAGGLCTRHRVSPYALAAAGMPLAMLPAGHYPLFDKSDTKPNFSMPRFARTNKMAAHMGQLGVDG